MKALRRFIVASIIMVSMLLEGQQRASLAAPAGFPPAPECPRRNYLPIIIQPGPAAAAPAGLAGQYRSPLPDFNGDGCADVAIGVPNKDLSTGAGDSHGQVNVVYGGWTGLTAIGNQTWHRDGGFDQDGNSLGDIQMELRANDKFGTALTTGDFNGDGYTDLAIGVSESIAGGFFIAGAVHVLYGSVDGLTAAGNQVWTQGGGWSDPEGDGSGLYQGDIYGGPEDNDRFGQAVAAGDYNGDGFADLAIGVPQEAVGSTANAGAVNLIYGSATGLTWVGNEMWHQDGVIREQNGSGNYLEIGDILGVVEAGDYFGAALAAGDFDGDTYVDLAIGVYAEAVGNLSDAGAVNVIYGTGAGLSAANNQSWHQDGVFEDTDGDGQTDIEIGNPSGTADASDWLGRTLAAADFNGDGRADLAVSAPRESLFEIENGVLVEEEEVGVIHIWYGTNLGLRLQNQRFWAQDLIEGVGDLQGSDREPFDRFGESLAVGDLNGDGYADIAAGAPNEALSEAPGSGVGVGAVSVLYGSANGLGIPGNQWFSQVSSVGDDGQPLGDFVGDAGTNFRFGTALFIADLNSDGWDELVIGVPGYRQGSSSDAIGAINLLLGSSAGAQFAGNQLWTLAGGQNDNGDFLGDLWGEVGDDLFGWALP